MDSVERLVKLNNEKIKVDSYMDRTISAGMQGGATSKVHVQMIDKVLRAYLHVIAEARLDDAEPARVGDATEQLCAGIVAEFIVAITAKGDAAAFVDLSNEITRAISQNLASYYEGHFGAKAEFAERPNGKKGH